MIRASASTHRSWTGGLIRENTSCPASATSAIGSTEPSDIPRLRRIRSTLMAQSRPTPSRSTQHSGTDRGGQGWQTAVTSIASNTILIRGYPVDELMGRLSFADAVYLLIMGEVQSPAMGRMLNAVVVSPLEHGGTSPSNLGT